jgi:hypothetical protein
MKGKARGFVLVGLCLIVMASLLAGCTKKAEAAPAAAGGSGLPFAGVTINLMADNRV